MKGLMEKKQAKLKKNHSEGEKPLERQREKPCSGPVTATRGSELEKDNQVKKNSLIYTSHLSLSISFVFNWYFLNPD